jgi:hypothetical protein
MLTANAYMLATAAQFVAGLVRNRRLTFQEVDPKPQNSQFVASFQSRASPKMGHHHQ